MLFKSSPFPDSLRHRQPNRQMQTQPVRPAYDRVRDLSHLLPLWPHEIAAVTPAARRLLVAKLRRALRVERQRGIAGHSGYDLARHAALLNAYRAEQAALGGQLPVANGPFAPVQPLHL